MMLVMLVLCILMLVLKIWCRLLLVKILMMFILLLQIVVMFKFLCVIFSSVLCRVVCRLMCGILLLVCIILLICSNSLWLSVLFGCDRVKFLVVKLWVFSRVMVRVLFIISVVVVFDVGVSFNGQVFFGIFMYRWIFVVCVMLFFGWLVIQISFICWCLRIGISVRILFDLLEFDSVIIIFCGVIIFKLLCVVLLGWIKNVEVLVLVKVVVILWLMWLDLFIFIIMIFLLQWKIVLQVWVKFLFMY